MAVQNHERDSNLSALKAARAQSCWNIGILGVLTAASIVSFVYLLFLYEPAEAMDMAPLLKEVRQRVVANADTIAAEGVELAAETAPSLTVTFYEQFRRDVPVYLSALEDQGDVLVGELETELRKQLAADFKGFVVRHRKVLAAEFPEYASKEAVDRLEARFEKAAERLIERYYIDEFRKEARQTVALWREFEPLPKPESGPTLQDQLLEYLADWSLLKARELATE